MKSFLWHPLILSCGLILSNTASALDAADEEALKKTQELLQNPALRQKTLEKDADAARADQKVRELGVTEENSEEIYSITSDIAATLIREADGDPAKLQEMIQKAIQNPEAFAQSLSPEQIRRIKAVSSKIDKEKTKRP
jgi:hypothetical protein